MAHMESLWPRLAELPLVVESCENDRLHAVLSHEFQRVTTHVRLGRARAGGPGEDVSVHLQGGGPALSQLGVRVGGAGPRVAPGRPWPARRARARAAAGALRQLAGPRRAALDRARAPAARPLAGRALQARRGGDLVAPARPRSRGGSAITSSASPTTRRSAAPRTSVRRRFRRAW